MTEGLQSGAPHLVGSAGAGLLSQRPFTQKILFPDASWIEHAVGGDQSGNNVPVVTWNSSASFPSDPNRKSSWLHDRLTGDLSMNFYNVTRAAVHCRILDRADLWRADAGRGALHRRNPQPPSRHGQ